MSDEDRMVTSNEEADEEEDDDEEHGFDMANFMFGNVDSDGQLEADFLDESLAESGPTNSAAANSYKASTPAAAKVLQSAVEKIGESDITAEDDWLNETSSAPTEAPATSAAAASFAPASRATLSQAAFQDEDDYDVDEETAAPATTAEVKQMSFPVTAAPGGFTQAVPTHLADGVSAPAYPTVHTQSILASAPAVPPAVAPMTLAPAASLARDHAAGQPVQNLLKKPTTLQQQESDSDVITDRPDEDERQPAESEARLQQDPKRLQAFVRPKKHKGIKPIPWGLPLCQDPGPTGLAAIPDADLDLIHVIQWERDIMWDDSDDPSESSVRLRDDAQNGAATGIEEDEWDDLDRALDMGSDSPRAKHSRHQLPMSTLEPLPQKPAKGSHASVTTSIHPQMLRLNELAVSNQQQSAEAPGPAAAAGHLEIPTQKAKLAPFNPNLKADAWLLKMDLKGAEGGPPMQPPPALLLDLNDPNMTFEVLRGTEVEAFASAAATILPAMPKVQPDMVNLIVHSTAGAVMARFNISKDSVYFPAGKRKGDKPGAVSRLHTTQASNMTTIPLIFPTRSEMFHRPLGLWNPLVSKKLHVKNQNKLQIDEMLVKISSLVGGNPNWHTGEPLTISFKKVSAAETVRALWGKAKQDKFKGSDSAGNPIEEQPPLLVDRRNPVQPLDLDASLHNSVLKEPVLEFAAIFSSIKLLPTVVANAVPSQTSGAALAPPAAFQKRKDLSATEGHVLLLEYFEEFPLMLSHPGMGAKLTTYYRRESATDNNHQRLLKEHDKWRVGNVEPLQAQEESPFIGQLDPGKHQLAIETGMYRAPGFAYTTPPTDFLLIRNATGAICLRELTGCFAVGQQVPAMRAPVPGSRDVREIEGGRLVVQVVRDLRSKQSRAEKAEAKTGKYVAPKVSFKELKQVFRHLSDQTIRIRLRDKCECVAVKENDLDGWWQLRPGARLPSEAELRRMLSPDQWCLYDTTKAGIHRLREQGISKYDALVQIPAERMQIAIEQLPEEKQAAGKYLDLAIKTTPWALTDNYVSRERENRGSQVAFAGPGDPTGKGRGFSFVKDTRRHFSSHKHHTEEAENLTGKQVPNTELNVVAKDMQPTGLKNAGDLALTQGYRVWDTKGMGHQAVKQKEGKLTGTNADLRRMKVPQLKEELRKVGVPEDMIKNGRRWELVDLLRTVATVGEGDSNFARNQRMTAAEMMARKTRLCQEIWQRQVAVLANIPEQQASGETASEDDMGEELQACLAGNEEAESAPAKPAEEDQQRLNEAQQAAEDEAALQAMREEGMLSDQPASSHPQPGRLRSTLGFVSTELPNMGHLPFPSLPFPSLPFPSLPLPPLPSLVWNFPVVPKKKLEAEPGARRMRRKITWTRPDGTVAIKEIIYTQEHDQDKVCSAFKVSFSGCVV
ncbi:MAG: transcription initiation factor subunit TAF1 [Trebouxia sp. A1-2]|nr:MAG: transcription initiation factor subunit TAF1 [Trebouxia sp. A1-2]